jgi:hypothetical protein
MFSTELLVQAVVAASNPGPSAEQRKEAVSVSKAP